MDETIAPTAAPDAVARAAADQPVLPLLTFDDGVDEPIGYTLTARARLEVAPDQVPPLRIVDPQQGDGEADLDRPGDTRPSRARALRRAGATLAEISDELGVDELVVRAWVGDVGARHGRRAAAPPSSTEQADHGRHEAFELARAAARDGAGARLDDPVFAAGLGLVSGALSADPHGATIATSRIEVAAAVVRWLRRNVGVDDVHLRVVLRLGPDVAGDLARHRWSAALGLPRERVLRTRWRGAPAGDAVEVLLRVTDAGTSACLAGWQDALLSDPGAGDVRDAGF